MHVTAESPGKGKRILPSRRWSIAWQLLLAAGVMMLAAAGPAAASYPGRTGTIAFQEFQGSIDANGAESDEYSMRFVRPPGRAFATRVPCQGTNLSDFSGYGEQYCPLFSANTDSFTGGGPSWSPDGKSLVFSGALYHNDGSRTPTLSGCPGSCGAIVLADADGSSPRLLPVTIADAEQPAFMPDAKTLIFAGKTNPGVPYDLYRVATDGSALRRLTSNGASQPAPCANGSVVYVHDDNLYLRGAGGRARRLTRYGGATLPDCSRDSRTIAFVRAGALYTIYATGRDLRRLTPRHVVDGRPAFSPAGGVIAVTTTITTADCAAGNGQSIYRLELIDLRGRLRRSYVTGREYCAEANPMTLGAAAWQPLPTRTG